MTHFSYPMVGHVATDPHYTATAPHNGVCKFRLAAHRSYKDEEEGWKDKDQFWVTVECWGMLARNARVSLRKGMPVIVVGVPTTDTYQREDGSTAVKVVLKAQFIGPDLNKQVANTVSTNRHTTVADPSAPLPMGGVDIPPGNYVDDYARCYQEASDLSSEPAGVQQGQQEGKGDTPGDAAAAEEHPGVSRARERKRVRAVAANSSAVAA